MPVYFKLVKFRTVRYRFRFYRTHLMSCVSCVKGEWRSQRQHQHHHVKREVTVLREGHLPSDKAGGLIFCPQIFYDQTFYFANLTGYRTVPTNLH